MMRGMSTTTSWGMTLLITTSWGVRWSTVTSFDTTWSTTTSRTLNFGSTAHMAALTANDATAPARAGFQLALSAATRRREAA
jgi:hypothetical protein